MKEEKKRILFWAIVCIIFIIFSILGVNLKSSGHGKYGKVIAKLTPISEGFNTLHDVIIYGDLKSQVKNDRIVVTYINPSTEDKEKYEYFYKVDGNTEYITNTYESAVGEYIAKQMVNTIYKKNGGKNNLYDIYDYDAFSASNVQDGVNLSGKTISINLNTNIEVSLKGKVKTKIDNNYLKDEDLVTLKDELSSEKRVTKTLEDIKLYVIENDTFYEIYLSYNETNKDRVLKSLANVIKQLRNDIYPSLVDNNGLAKFDTNETENYKYYENTEYNEITLFNGETNILKLELNK